MNRPCYSIVGEATLDEWLTDNLPELVGHYVKLTESHAGPGLFLEFCRGQYEEQREIDDEPMDEHDLAAAEADIEDGWFTEEEQARA